MLCLLLTCSMCIADDFLFIFVLVLFCFSSRFNSLQHNLLSGWLTLCFINIMIVLMMPAFCLYGGAAKPWFRNRGVGGFVDRWSSLYPKMRSGAFHMKILYIEHWNLWIIVYFVLSEDHPVSSCSLVYCCHDNHQKPTTAAFMKNKLKLTDFCVVQTFLCGPNHSWVVQTVTVLVSSGV